MHHTKELMRTHKDHNTQGTEHTQLSFAFIGWCGGMSSHEGVERSCTTLTPPSTNLLPKSMSWKELKYKIKKIKKELSVHSFL